MKKFSKYTICSDLDGTLWGVDGTIPEANKEAISYFTENGGCFVLTTGRSPDFIKSLQEKGLYSKPYAIALNGAMIYDTENNKSVYENVMDISKLTGFEKLLEENRQHIIDVVYHTNGDVSEFSQLDGKKLYKIVFIVKTPESLSEIRKQLETNYGENCFITNSWATGLEILDKKSTKGEAVLKLKELLNDNAQHIICVGDYENDIPMLEKADVSYAVSNAHEDVKRIADRVTVSNIEGAIAQIIKDIENEIK